MNGILELEGKAMGLAWEIGWMIGFRENDCACSTMTIHVLYNVFTIHTWVGCGQKGIGHPAPTPHPR